MNEKQKRYVVKFQSIKKAMWAKVILFIALFFTGLVNAGNVEFDKKVDETIFASLPNLKSAKNTHDLVWKLTFTTATDMRPALFDFAQANNLRTLQIVLKSKNLEQIFREKTAKKK